MFCVLMILTTATTELSQDIQDPAVEIREYASFGTFPLRGEVILQSWPLSKNLPYTTEGEIPQNK